MVHTWDLRMHRCVSRARDEGGFCSTSLAVSRDGRLYATGSKAGVVNLYERSARWVERWCAVHGSGSTVHSTAYMTPARAYETLCPQPPQLPVSMLAVGQQSCRTM